jgi:hypothetical protein
MSDASDLAAEIVIHESDVTLRRLSRWGENATNTVNSTVLESCCSKAIRTFNARFGTYDSTNELHVDCAHKLAMIELWLRTDLPDASDRVRDLRSGVPNSFAVPAIPIAGQRRLIPRSNSPFVEPSPPAANSAPVFGNDFFEGYVAE